jgi:hypothetical protein
MIITAKQSATEPSWYLQARDTELNTQLGWAEYMPGIEVKQMPDAAVLYAGVRYTSPNLMIVRFQATVRAMHGSKIRVYYPEPYTVLQCNDPTDAGRFYKMSLNGNVDCAVFEDQSYLELLLHSAMDPGWQAFAVQLVIADAVPNTFDILVYEPESAGGKVIDGATNLPGLSSVNPLLALTIGELVWGDCKALSSCQVRLSFVFHQDMPDNIPKISEIVVKPPPTLEYQIDSLSQVTLAGPFPFRSPALDVSDNGYFRLLLLPVVTIDQGGQPVEQPQFTKGTYSVQFETKMPTRSPANNVWLLIFCGIGNTTCVDPHDARALTSFPVIGFNIGEEHPTGIKSATSGVVRSYSLAFVAMTAFLIVGSY